MYTLHLQRISIAVLGTIMLAINLLLVNETLLGVTGLIIYLFGMVTVVSPLLQEKVIKKKHIPGWSLLLMLCWLISANAIVYYIAGLTNITLLVVLLIPLLLGYKNTGDYTFPLLKKKQLNQKSVFFLTFFLFGELGLIASMIDGRTTDLLRSPWHAVSPEFFLLYAGATAFLFALIYTTKNSLVRYFCTSLHLFVTYNVATIVYALGFGFDAFIHRATEDWITTHGFILPKTPYYIGQYGFVVWLRRFTQIPLSYIDVYLVPVLASLTLPAVIVSTFKDKTNVYLALWLLPFLPFLSFLLTTPYNLALLLTVVTIFLSLSFLKQNIPWFLPAGTTLATLFVHPLLGVPVALFFFYALLHKKYSNSGEKVSALTFSLIFDMALVLPAMFVIQQMIAGHSFPKLTNPFSKISDFISLFSQPYWYADSSLVRFEILYTWQTLIPVVYICLAIFGAYIYKNRQTMWLLVSTTIGLIIGAWLLRSWIVFPDVAVYEQGDYPLRIVKASMLFLLPLSIVGVTNIIEKVSQKNHLKIAFAIAAGGIMMISFYLSYPQHNHKVRFPGLNVTASDYTATNFIADKHSSYDYIVLANQLVSASALDSFSFAKYFDTEQGEIFYYSIPTGGILYNYYGEMLYEGQKRESMVTAMDIVGVNTSYFVVNSYWADSEKIIEGAKKTADSWHIVDDGKVWIFEYNR